MEAVNQGTAAALEVENFDEAINQLENKVFGSRLSLLRRRVVTWRWCKIPMETNL